MTENKCQFFNKAEHKPEFLTVFFGLHLKIYKR